MRQLLTPDEMNQADRITVDSGTPVLVLMERAGRAVAAEVRDLAPAGGRVVILCGPGNNGGDGFVCARVLAGRGFRVTVATLDGRKPAQGVIGQVAADWLGPLIDVATLDFKQFELCIDALFGAGLSRPVTGEAADCLGRLSGSGLPVLAVDVPSGLDGASGQVRGFAVQARRTVTFFRQKPGHLLQPGRDLCGEVVLADIGIDPACLSVIAPKAAINGPDLWHPMFPTLDTTTHKYRRGSVLVLSNRLEYSGAARLAAKAALRSGAGLVTLATPSDAMTASAAHSDAIMLRRCDTLDDWTTLLADPRRNALVIGPGLGFEGEAGILTREQVLAGIATGRAQVLDASGLSAFEGQVDTLALWVHQADFKAGFEPVITPHEGEFVRLFSGMDEIFKPESKCNRARMAARKLGCVVVYKGSDTVIAAPDGRVAINNNGTVWLATAGSGDVLSGAVAAFCGQSVPSFEAACMGVWFHAEAGQAIGPYACADDLPHGIQQVLRGYYRANFG